MSKILDFFKKVIVDKKSEKEKGERLGTLADYEAEKSRSREKALQELEQRRLQQEKERIRRETLQSASDPSCRAANAALQRMDLKSHKPIVSPTSSSADYSREKREILEAEALAAVFAPPKIINIEKPSVIQHVLFTCPELFGKDCPPLPKTDLMEQIVDYCHQSIQKEPTMAHFAAVLLLYTCNPKVKVNKCVETLLTILNNVKENPSEEKYRKLRLENKRLSDEIFTLTGALEFLKVCGFVEKSIPRQNSENEEEKVLILPNEITSESLEDKIASLTLGEAMPLTLYRDTRVFKISGQVSLEKVDLPSDFYAISEEEMKREYARQQQVVEQTGMLLTKAMRERMEQKELRRYNYCLIRVRFPDNTMLQGTFEAQESVNALMEWISSYINYQNCPFQLNSYACRRIHEQNGTLAEFKLTPMAVINFSQISDDGSIQIKPPYLSPALLKHMQTL